MATQAQRETAAKLFQARLAAGRLKTVKDIPSALLPNDKKRAYHVLTQAENPFEAMLNSAFKVYCGIRWQPEKEALREAVGNAIALLTVGGSAGEVISDDDALAAFSKQAEEATASGTATDTATE